MPRSGSDRPRRWPWILGALLLVLIAARLAAPAIVVKVVRNSLSAMEGGYHGDVRDVELSLLSGQVAMLDMSIVKSNGQVPMPFMYIPRFILGLSWSGIKPCNELIAIGAQVHMVDAEAKARQQWGPKFELRDLREQLPLELSAVRFENGALYFHKLDAKPQINLAVRRLNAVWEDLDGCLPPGEQSCESSLTARAEVQRGASLSLRGAFDRHHGPNFSSTARVSRLEPAQLNALLLGSGKRDVKEGRIDLTAHYQNRGDDAQRLVLVPRLYDVKVMGSEHEGEVKIWREMLAGIAAGYFERRRGEKAITYEKRGKKGEWQLIDWQKDRLSKRE